MVAKNVVPNKLHQELSDAGIKCNIRHNLADGRYFIGECAIKLSEGTDMDLVKQIIDAHDPTPLPRQLTREEILEQRINELELYILTREGLI